MDAAAGPLVRARHDLLRGRPDRALVALDQVTGAELEDEEFWLLRAAALHDAGDPKAAVEAAQKGLVYDPADFGLLDVLALAQLGSGRKKDARATIESSTYRTGTAWLGTMISPISPFGIDRFSSESRRTGKSLSSRLSVTGSVRAARSAAW